MVTCCELALWISVSAFIVILSLLAMFFNYNLKLDARTVKLERKNGSEQHQIDELKKEITQLKNQNEQLLALPKAKTTP